MTFDARTEIRIAVGSSEKVFDDEKALLIAARCVKGIFDRTENGAVQACLAGSCQLIDITLLNFDEILDEIDVILSACV